VIAVLGASAGVILLTVVALIAALYAFVCEIRAERVAQTAVKRVRAMQPAVWQELDWIVRLANPVIKMKVLRSKHGVGGPDFDSRFDVVKRLERQQLIAAATVLLCVALVVIGSKSWGWTWD
jgi:hypothetical protein